MATTIEAQKLNGVDLEVFLAPVKHVQPSAMIKEDYQWLKTATPTGQILSTSDIREKITNNPLVPEANKKHLQNLDNVGAVLKFGLDGKLGSPFLFDVYKINGKIYASKKPEDPSLTEIYVVIRNLSGEVVSQRNMIQSLINSISAQDEKIKQTVMSCIKQIKFGVIESV